MPNPPAPGPSGGHPTKGMATAGPGGKNPGCYYSGMLRRLLVAWVLAGPLGGRAAELPFANGDSPPAPAAPEPAKPAGTDPGPLLPLHLPGYELRVLDVKKPLLFHLAGTWVEVSVPIFFYLATPAHEEGLKRLRRAAEDLRQLLRKPAWTSAELAQVQAELKAGAAQLAQP